MSSLRKLLPRLPMASARGPATLALACALPSLVACTEKESCDLDAEAKRLAGRGATFCGRVAIDGERAEVDACVRRELEAKRAFWVRYDMQAEAPNASGIARAVVRDGMGRVSFLDFDSSPCGSPACGARILARFCSEPSAVQPDPRAAPVSCGQQADPQVLCD